MSIAYVDVNNFYVLYCSLSFLVCFCSFAFQCHYCKINGLWTLIDNGKLANQIARPVAWLDIQRALHVTPLLSHPAPTLSPVLHYAN